MKVKSYTDLEQSKKLAEFLPPESADMYYPNRTDIQYKGALPIGVKHGNPLLSQEIPCWGLAALLEQLPSVIKGHNLTIRKDYWQIEKTFAYELSYEEDFEDYPPSILVSTSSIEFVDACVEMIIKLKEKNLL